MTSGNWITFVQIAATIVMAWIGWSLRTMKACIRAEMKVIANDVDAVRRRLTEAEDDIERKVSREDFIRESSRNRQILERLMEGQARLEGKMDVGTRIAASVERISEKLAEKSGG
jgi:hypothetical protein